MYYIQACFVLGLYWSTRVQHGGFQYSVSELRSSWSDASASCHLDNSTLASIASPETDEYLISICPDDSET